MASPGGAAQAELESLRRAAQDVEARMEDPEIAIRYLENIVLHPDDLKYRKIKKGNRKFSSEVWLQSGVRRTFLAIGFREEREEDGTAMVLLDPLTDECRRRTEVALKRFKDIRDRRRRGGGPVVAVATSGGAAGTYPGAGAAEPRPNQASRPSGGNGGDMTCNACGKSGLQEDTRSNRPDVLYRAWRPNLAITCMTCPTFFVCGDCFNRQSYQHAPDHQLVLYARQERLAEQSPWPSRYRGNMPPPPGPGRGGRPRRGPWG